MSKEVDTNHKMAQNEASSSSVSTSTSISNTTISSELECPEELCKTLAPFMMKEFMKGNFLETKIAFLQRFWYKIGKSMKLKDIDMGISTTSYYGKSGGSGHGGGGGVGGVSGVGASGSAAVYIHIDVVQMVEELYNSIRATGIKHHDNLRRHFTAFNSNRFQELSEIKSLLREFVKAKEINKDPNNENKKDKVLKDNSLNTILAVDGMLGREVGDLNNYIPHLSVGNIPSTKEEQHVVAVRKMYRQIPQVITGTDSTYLITMALLNLYNQCIDPSNDLHPIIQKQRDKCRDYLLSQSNYYQEIKNVLQRDFLTMLENVYSSTVANVKDIAKDKIDLFTATLKKKNISESKKEIGEKRKRQLEEEEEEQQQQQQDKNNNKGDGGGDDSDDDDDDERKNDEGKKVEENKKGNSTKERKEVKLEPVKKKVKKNKQ